MPSSIQQSGLVVWMQCIQWQIKLLICVSSRQHWSEMQNIEFPFQLTHASLYFQSGSMGQATSSADSMGHAASYIDQFRLAVWSGRLDKMKLLGRKVDDIRIYDSKARPVLHLAVANRQYGVIDWLLKTGIDPNIPDSHGVRPLHRALWANDEVTIRILLDHGADPYASYPNGDEPLVVAAFKNNFNIVRMLLDLDYTMSHVTNCEQTAVVANKTEGIMDFVCFEETIFSSPSKHRSDRHGITPLHLAAQKGHWQVMNALVSHGYSLNSTIDTDGRTALHEACASGQYGCVEELLRLGASMSSKDREDLTPLMFTAKLGNPGIMSLLVRRDRKLNRMNKYKKTALHLACAHNNTECIRMLLEYGAGSKKITRIDQMPPIHCLAISHRPEIELINILRIFIQTNADLDFECRPYGKGLTPIGLAFEKRNFKIACWLALVGCKIKDMPFDDAPEPYKQYLFMKKTEVPSLMVSCRESIRQHFGHHLQRYIWSQACPESVERCITFTDIMCEEMDLPFHIWYSICKWGMTVSISFQE